MAEQAEEIFVGHDSEILFHGQPAGIILADTFALANYAATKVKIIYEKFYRKLHKLLSIYFSHNVSYSNIYFFHIIYSTKR